MNHVDLFAGIGGFSLGAINAGMKTVAHVEIDKKCQSVLRKNFTDTQIYDDVRTFGKRDCEYADVITFGSPCQDLSIAGKRDGLSGARSGLFYEAVRIIDELEPKYAVWENVPGALSSNGGGDFRKIIEALVKSEVPMPKSGRWAPAGMVRSGKREIVWRVLDAQYFGVAQRRRRVFVVVGFGGRSAAEILFEREGVCWNPPPRRETRKENTGIVGTLSANDGGTNRPAGNANELDFCVSHTLTAKQGYRSNFESETLIAFNADRDGTSSENISPTLTSKGNKQSDHGAYQKMAIAWNWQSGGDVRYDFNDKPMLHSSQVPAVGVRRLMPVECERLQGFQDGWTSGQADSSRYQQLGNAVCVNVVTWIMNRIASYEKQFLPV
jgi:DNA (cytosine-5)-methyltransferase 1